MLEEGAGEALGVVVVEEEEGDGQMVGVVVEGEGEAGVVA